MKLLFFSMMQQPRRPGSPSLSTLHDHTQTHHTPSVGLLWASDQPVAETST
jgi:hypothetical protein